MNPAPLRLLSLLLLGAPLLWSAEQVPGTGIALDPPPDFVRAEQFAGYVSTTQNASIMVTEMPVPYAEMSAGLTAGNLAQRGMTLLATEEVRVPAGEGRLLHVEQTAQGIVFEKWILAVDDAGRTTMVIASFPASTSESLSAPLRRSVLSVSKTATMAGTLDETSSFSVEERAPLKRATRIGPTLLFTLDGVIPAKSPDDPLVVAGMSATQNVFIPDHSNYARARLQKTEHVTAINVLEESAIEIDGLSGRLCLAEGRDVQTSKPRFILQAMLFSPHGYFLFQAFCAGEQRSEYEPVFREMLQTFRQRKSPPGP